MKMVSIIKIFSISRAKCQPSQINHQSSKYYTNMIKSNDKEKTQSIFSICESANQFSIYSQFGIKNQMLPSKYI